MSEKRFKKLRQVHRRTGLPLSFLKKEYKNMNKNERSAVMGEDRSQ